MIMGSLYGRFVVVSRIFVEIFLLYFFETIFHGKFSTLVVWYKTFIIVLFIE